LRWLSLVEPGGLYRHRLLAAPSTRARRPGDAHPSGPH
jgi:hypothetical protein